MSAIAIRPCGGPGTSRATRRASRWEQRSAFCSPHLIRGLRHWDVGASRQPDHFIANSQTVAARIRRAYGRFAEVIHPPIDLERFRPSTEQDDYYIVLARLVSYKRIDLAVQACTLLGRRLLVIGDGPDRARLMANAGPTISFLGRLSDAEVEHHAARCRALIFPGEEDFGMAPLEIAAAGRPTIAYRGGGAVETIVEGVTGVFFDRQEPEDLAAAITRLRAHRLVSNAPSGGTLRTSVSTFFRHASGLFWPRSARPSQSRFLPFNAAPRTATESWDRARAGKVSRMNSAATLRHLADAEASASLVWFAAAASFLLILALFLTGQGALLRLAIPAGATLVGTDLLFPPSRSVISTSPFGLGFSLRSSAV